MKDIAFAAMVLVGAGLLVIGGGISVVTGDYSPGAPLAGSGVAMLIVLYATGPLWEDD